MAAPTFVDSIEGPTWATGSGTTRAMSITVQTGDVLVVVASVEDNSASAAMSITGAGGQTWTQKQDSGVVASRCRVYGWTATSVTTGSITVTVTCANPLAFGAEIYAFRGSGGIGNTVTANGSSDDPSFATLTTAGANSAIVMCRADWQAGDTATAVYRTASASTFTERTYYRDAVRYTTANGYHANAGTAAAKTLGHTTTGTVTENWTYVAVEVLGSASTDATVTAVTALAAGSAPAASVNTTGNGTVTAVPASSAGSAPIAALSAAAFVTAARALAAGSAPPANQIISAVVGAPAVIALGSAPAAVPAGVGVSATVDAVIALANRAAPSATVTAGATVLAAQAIAVGTAPAGATTQGNTVVAAVAACTGEAPRPTITPAPTGGGGGRGQVAVTFAEGV